VALSAASKFRGKLTTTFLSNLLLLSVAVLQLYPLQAQETVSPPVPPPASETDSTRPVSPDEEVIEDDFAPAPLDQEGELPALDEAIAQAEADIRNSSLTAYRLGKAKRVVEEGAKESGS
jgi:hypothetical protein